MVHLFHNIFDFSIYNYVSIAFLVSLCSLFSLRVYDRFTIFISFARHPCFYSEISWDKDNWMLAILNLNGEENFLIISMMMADAYFVGRPNRWGTPLRDVLAFILR